MYLVGDGAKLCFDALAEEIPGLCLLLEHLRHQRAAGVAICAREAIARGETGDGGSLIPNYLRLSQAERERLQRLGEV